MEKEPFVILFRFKILFILKKVLVDITSSLNKRGLSRYEVELYVLCEDELGEMVYSRFNKNFVHFTNFNKLTVAQRCCWFNI